MTIKLLNNDTPSQQQDQKPCEQTSQQSNEATSKEDVDVVGVVDFPIEDLQRLDEMLNRTRWIVPVLPKNELETLLDASIALCRKGLDTKSEHCQKFFRDGLTLSFIRILTDDAVNTWKHDIYKHIYNNTLKAIELCSLKLLDDWMPLLELLALIFNPQCKYHILNSMRTPELVIKVNLPKSIESSANETKLPSEGLIKSNCKNKKAKLRLSKKVRSKKDESRENCTEIKNNDTDQNKELQSKTKELNTGSELKNSDDLEEDIDSNDNNEDESDEEEKDIDKLQDRMKYVEIEDEEEISDEDDEENDEDEDDDGDEDDDDDEDQDNDENDQQENDQDDFNNDNISVCSSESVSNNKKRNKSKKLSETDLNERESRKLNNLECLDDDDEILNSSLDNNNKQIEKLDKLVNDYIQKEGDVDFQSDPAKELNKLVTDTNSTQKGKKKKLNKKQQRTKKTNSNDKRSTCKTLNANLSNITGNSSNNEINLSKNELSLSKLSDTPLNTPNKEKLNSNSVSTHGSPNILQSEQEKTLLTVTTYARSYLKASYGWLIDFINYFGELNGFKLLLERFTNNVKLSIQVIAALLKPWGLCYQFLTPYTVKTFFLPIIEIVPKFFENLSDEDIKKECKSENKNDSISTVIKWLKLLATRVHNQEELCKNLEILRLKTILRILKFASFNGKMNALNEVNKVISNITYNMQLKVSNMSVSSSSCLNRNEHNEEWLTSDRMAKWIQENDVLDIVLSDCMHQPQYVEKLEKILRFLIKEKSLTLKDLDKIWESQLGKHEAIEKNVHDLLSKLAWDFTPEQLDHLFSCFQKSWTNASKKQREKLLDLIRSLSEDDKEGVMANKVLDLLWNMAHSEDAPTEIIDQAVAAHIKILDYSCSSDKEAQKLKCLEKCIEQLKENKWVIVSLRQIREILQQYSEMMSGSFQTQRLMNYSQQNNSNSNNNMLLIGNNNNGRLSSEVIVNNQNPAICFYRPDVITKLQKEYSLISMITANLANYYDSVRKYVAEQKSASENIDPDSILADGRFNHSTQIQERLNFLKYLLKEGQLWLCSAQAETIWKCLAQNSIFESDREICFKWFSKLMTDDPDLEPDMNKTFFVNYVIKLDPKLLTDSGIKCFDRFFKNVNLKCSRLIQKRNYFLTESLDLVGIDYLWKIVSFANEDIVEKAICLLKDIYIHLGPQLKSEQCAIHADLISNCMDRLRVSHDNLTILNKNCKTKTKQDSIDHENQNQTNDLEEKNDEIRSNQEITQILRVMIVLREYLNEFDTNYLCERVFPPLNRSSKGKSILIYIRLQIQNRQADDIEIISHVNETIGSLRRQIFIKTKINPQISKIDLIINNECIECVDDNKILADYQLKEKMFIIARVSQTSSGIGNSSSNSNMNTGIHNSNSGGRLDSSGDSSSDECGSGNEDAHNVINSPSIEHELMLPSVILSLNEQYVQFLIELADFGCKINNTQIKECTRNIIDLLPIAKHTSEKIRNLCKECQENQNSSLKSNKTSNLEGNALCNLYFNCTQTQCWYYLKVTHALLMPAVFSFNHDEIKQFQENFILAGGVTCFKNMIVKEDFLLNADDNTKKAALLYVLKINKLTMTTVCHSIYSHVLNAFSTKQYSQITDAHHNHALLLQNSVSSIPSSTNEITTRTLAQRLGSQFSSLLVNNLPDLTHIIKLERIAWSLASNGTLNLVSSPYERIHEVLSNNKSNDFLMDNLDDINVCREALECLSLSLCLVPNALENLNQEKHWRSFIIDLVLICSNRLIRQTASEQFLLIALKCSIQPNRPIQFFIQMLFTCLINLQKNAQQSQEYFFLLCRLLNCANINNVQISNTETLLNNEITWLKKIKQQQSSLSPANISNNPNKIASNLSNIDNKTLIGINEETVDEMLLDGHLNITKELLSFQNAEKKYAIGCHPQGFQLIQDLIEYFLLPSSYLFKKYRDSLIASASLSNDSTNQTALNNFEQLLASKSLKPICNSSMTVVSAYDLLVSLCSGCLPNLKELSDLLFHLFYPSLISSSCINLDNLDKKQQHQSLYQSYNDNSSFNFGNNNQLSNDCTIAQNEWEYIPPIGQRPQNGFVGLKNAGATCYMNSVLQQLFMIKSIRNFILSVDTSSANVNNDTSKIDDLDEADSLATNLLNSKTNGNDSSEILHSSKQGALSEEEQRKEYNMSIFRHLQMIYGHLAESKMQYYVPKGFWRQFRFGNDRVNLREQHDAVEFFNSVVDCIDEAMKSINREQICSQILGGTFADQKICKGCPHRYSREESFTLLSVDVKHSQRLSESLEQYVKGDLLEGPNAYHCEKCNKKIDAVKRTCIKKLPLVLAIQLKRFDYDWEREIAVKSNEYFEFPRELDMEPYTVKGVARIEKQHELLKKRQQQVNLAQQQSLNTSNSENNNEHSKNNANLKANSTENIELNSSHNEEKSEKVEDYYDEEDDDESSGYSNNYKLVGIVVHSGQANGGHYYSFIQNKSSSDDEDMKENDLNTNNSTNSTNNYENNWYKFDDGEVSEFKMDDEEMRNQCYGGEYTGEVYDNIMKRMSYKKQKRWWNAYILFYERLKNDSNKSFNLNDQGNSNQSKQQINKTTENESSSLLHNQVKMPAYILRSVHKKNIKFSHHRHHFSVEYFQFIKKLTQVNLYLCQGDSPMTNEIEELCLVSVNLALKFLFGVGFRVKKTLRGAVNDWYEILFNYAKYSLKARNAMFQYLFIENSVTIAQYFLDCPSNEIRTALSKLLVALTHLSYSDSPLPIKSIDLFNYQQQPSISILVPSSSNSDSSSLDSKQIHYINQSDSIIQTVLSLLSKRDLINEQSSKYLVQYFQYFNYYSTLGLQQCMHLIKYDVPFVLMQFALDELPTTVSNINLNSLLSSSSSSSSFALNYSKLSNNIQNHGSNNTSSSQYADLNKLYCVVSTLIRCYDISSFQNENANTINSALSNPYSYFNELKSQQQESGNLNKTANSNVIIKLPAKLEELLYKKTNYLKKLLDDVPNLEETVKLMKFLCWENISFSMILINELLWMAAYHYSYELKPHLEILFHILNINDSWQVRRIIVVLQGSLPNDKEGLFDIIFKSQNHYQKRAYQIIKTLVHLFTTCDVAIELLNKDEDLKKKWKQSRNWFYHEMEKCRIYNMPNYSYFQTPQSNETSQTYFLERTQSARLTLEKAMRICPQTMSSSGPGSSNAQTVNKSEQNEDQIDNDEEDAYESISDEDNLESRIKSNKTTDSNANTLTDKTTSRLDNSSSNNNNQ